MLAFVLVVAVGGGVAGGLVALALDEDVPPAAVATAPATPTPSQPRATQSERLRAAIDATLPAVVTVLADLPARAVEGGQLLRQNIGSGVVISGAGHVITNYHVVDGADSIVVALSTGERRPAELLDDDFPFHDLAVLRIEPDGLRSVALGDSDALRLGDPAIAVSGGLVTFANQVKLGVISATHVAFPRPGLIQEDMVQTDAAVNHGDSGGALVNLEGELVGLLTTVVRQTPDGRTVEGVALAHSMNSLRPVVEAVVQTGTNPRPRHGIERLGRQHVPLTPELAEQLDLPLEEGALIREVAPGSPAEAAGVRPGDVVVGVSGVAITEDLPLVNALARLPGDGSADLFIVRDGRELIITVTPVPREEQQDG